MKRLLLMVAVGVAVLFHCNDGQASPIAKASNFDSVSYAIGAYEGISIKQKLDRSKLTLHDAKFLDGMKDALNKDTSALKMNSDKSMSVINDFFSKRQAEEDAGNLENYVQGIGTLSYAIGAYEGIAMKKKLKGANMTVDEGILLAGLRDAMSKDSTALRIDEELSLSLITNFFSKRQEGEKVENLKNGSEFLADNAKKKGVQITASGLQYKKISQGAGLTPELTDKVEVHYTGTLIDGTQFDSSRERGEPVAFPVNGVIKGWTEGLQLMKEGDRFTFYIPSSLAYGDQSAGGIPAGSTLIFDIELLKVNRAE